MTTVVNETCEETSGTLDISLRGFLEEFEDELSQKIKERMNPLLDPTNLSEWDRATIERIRELCLRRPFRAQEHLISAGIKHLVNSRVVFLVAEMGCGKTLMSIMIAAADPTARRHLVMCPPHLVKKWCAEINKTLPAKYAAAYNFNGRNCVKKLSQLPASAPKVHEFYIIGRERVKHSYGWRHISFPVKRENSRFGINTIPCCPKCATPVDPDAWRKGAKNYCTNAECREAFWVADSNRTLRFSPAEYIKRRMPKYFFHTLIADEVHELKGESAQGVAFQQLAKSVKRVIPLTGTFTGGYADDIFYLLWRTVAPQMKLHGEKHNNRQGWLERYGVLEKTYRSNDRDNAQTRGMKLTNVKRKPGISPVVLSQFVIPNALFMKLSDIADELPQYEEQVHVMDMDPPVEAEYKAFEQEVTGAMYEALRRGDKTVMSRMLQALLAWPDACRAVEKIEDKEAMVVATANAIEIDVTAKERMLIEIVQKNLVKGRKSMIFAEFTGTRDILPVISERLQEKGIRPLVMKSTIAAERREEWIEEQMETGQYDCLLCNPKLVQTGLDLIRFPEVIFFQTGYSVFVLRQAARRSWRIGQPHPVKVNFLCNKGTMQETALTLMAQKLETALAIEGDLSDEGLTAMSDGGGIGSMVLELARSLVDKGRIQGVEAAWSKYRKREEAANGFVGNPPDAKVVVIDDPSEPEPEKLKAQSIFDRMKIVQVESAKPQQLSLFAA